MLYSKDILESDSGLTLSDGTFKTFGVNRIKMFLFGAKRDILFPFLFQGSWIKYIMLSQ